MHKTSFGWALGVLILGMILVSACTQTYSQAPLATPTLISTGLFVSPFPSGQDPLQVVANLGTQTAAAKTAQAGGGTPVAAVSGTPATQSALVGDTNCRNSCRDSGDDLSGGNRAACDEE